MSELNQSLEKTLSLIIQERKRLEKQEDEIKEGMILLNEQRRFGKIDAEHLEKFFEQPYVTLPSKRKNEWLIIVPRFIDFQIGWLEKSTQSFNVFKLNKYSAFLDTIPIELQSKLKFEESLPLEINDSVLTTGISHQEEIWEKYGGSKKYFNHRVGKSQIKIKKGYEFQLIAELIKDGCLPFSPQEVDKKHLRDFPDFGYELYDYQQEAWETFLHWGAVGIFWMMKAGKSIYGLYALGRLKGKKLIIVPSLDLKFQWIEHINRHPKLKYETEVITYHARNSKKQWDRIKKTDYTVVIFDEAHYLPAKTFIPFSTLKTEYRIGLSATPFREDGKEHLIFALTGKPIGMDWNILFDRGIVHKPDITILLSRDKTVKDKKLTELLREVDIKTMVFCDSIELGMKLKKKYGIPFIHGSTPATKRLPLMRESQQFIVSRVGDEGISLPSVERIIEYDFLFGSRRQEGQRVGRAHHTENADYIILVTETDYERYEKRFLALYEKGYKIRRMRI